MRSKLHQLKSVILVSVTFVDRPIGVRWWVKQNGDRFAAFKGADKKAENIV